MTVRKLTILGSVALLFSGTAWAQDEQARKILPHELGGPFLVFRDKVQAELKLSDDQKQKIRETLPDYAPETMKTFAKLKDMEPEERQREMEPLRRRSRERFAAFLKGTLWTEQLTRLKQLELQHEGPGVLGRPDIRKDLKITDGQWTQIMGVIQELQRKLQTLILEAQTKGNPREVLPRAIKLRNDYGIKVEAVLSDAQRKQWREMLGKSVDVFTD
jgi:Spy/CpxP family protein refolding chaperone